MTFSKQVKRLISKAYLSSERARRAKSDPLLYSMSERPRWRSNDKYGEGLCEYGIKHMEDWSDEAVQGYFDSCRVEIHSDYDCTGELFTAWIHWHRNPDGSVSYVHQLLVDW